MIHTLAREGIFVTVNGRRLDELSKDDLIEVAEKLYEYIEEQREIECWNCGGWD